MPIDVWIYDGVDSRKTDFTSVALEWGKQRNRRVICITSYQFTVGSNSDARYEPLPITSRLWTLSEYKEACQSREFLDQIRVNLVSSVAGDDDKANEQSVDSMLADKYFLTGGCVRHMFGYSTERAVERLRRYLELLPNVQEVMNRTVGANSEDAVNHIFCHEDNQFSIISQFAARELSRAANNHETIGHFLHQAYPQFAGNSTMLGWLFQMDFFWRLNKAHTESQPLQVIERSADGLLSLGPVQWPAQAKFEFFHPNELTFDVLPDHSWFIPRKVNQGCFDVVYFKRIDAVTDSTSDSKEQVGELHFIQITVAESHSLKYAHVLPLLDTLRAKRIKITALRTMILVPTSQKELKMATVTSDNSKRLKVYTGTPSQISYFGMDAGPHFPSKMT